MSILVDTNMILAAADTASRDYEAALGFLEQAPEPLVVPVTVLAELDYMANSRLGTQAEVRILRGLAGPGFHLEPLLDEDFDRAIDLVEQYADSDIGLVDASIVAIAERLHVTRIATLDHRHFALFRPRHCRAFELVP